MKKLTSLILAMTAFSLAGVVSAKSFTDVPEGYWAKEKIETWSEYGVINGYEGQFSPTRSITRGEFAVVLNKLMTYEKTVKNSFADLGEKYYTDSILKLNRAGVMQGYAGNINPDSSLTREEAAVMICRALGIEPENESNKAFSDSVNVSDWARPYINAMVNRGLLNGSDGNLNPKNSISRAEVVTILDNAVLPILAEGVYTNIETDKILVISSGDVVIEDSEILGKVIVTQGAKEGNVTFSNTKIDGEVIIDNEREDIVILQDSTVGEEIKVDKDDKKEESSGNESSGGGGRGDGGGGSDKPSGGDDSEKDENDKPSQPETPTEPENPNDPETPTEPENPNDPETPSEPEEPKDPETPSEPEEPKDPETPSEPEEPKDPDEPNVPDSPSEPDEPEIPDEPEEPKIDYSEINAEMVENLELISDDISMYITSKYPDLYSVFTNEEKYMLRKIKACIDETITYADEREITANFIKWKFQDEIDDVKEVYDELRENDKHGEFHKKLGTNMTTYTLLWLADTLGIDLSEYGIDESEIM